MRSRLADLWCAPRARCYISQREPRLLTKALRADGAELEAATSRRREEAAASQAEPKAPGTCRQAAETVEGDREMSLKRTWLWWAVFMLLAGPWTAAAQSDVFMCVDGITGSSTDEQFAGCSEIFGVSYSVGVEGGEPPAGGGGGAARPTCGL
jgi:hypothetical protein